MSCQQSIPTSVLMRQVQEQVHQYRQRHHRGPPSTQRRSFRHGRVNDDAATIVVPVETAVSTPTTTPMSTLTEYEEAMVQVLPKSMRIRTCMEHAIQNHSLEDTILIPIQIIRDIHHEHQHHQQQQHHQNVAVTDAPIAPTTTTTTVTTATTLVDTVPPLPPTSSPTDTIIQLQPLPEMPLPPPQPPSRPPPPPPSSYKLSPPNKSFQKLMRVGNRRQRSVSSESSSSSSVSSVSSSAPTTTTFNHNKSPTTTMAETKYTEITTELRTLPPVRFRTLFKDPSTTATTAATSNLHGTIGSIAVLIRRPGCSMCQQEAYTLTLLSKIFCPEYFTSTTSTSSSSSSSSSSRMNHVDHDTHLPDSSSSRGESVASPRPMFTMFGIVKDIHDTVGIMECHDKYFPFPLYLNSTNTFYHAFGDRKLSLSHLLTSAPAWKAIMCNVYQSIFPTTTSSSSTHSSSSSSSSSGTTAVVSKVHSMTGRSTTMVPDDSNHQSNHHHHNTSRHHDITTTTTTTTASELSIAARTAMNDSTVPSPASPLSSVQKSDGILQGGLLFLSHTGVPVAMYPEETGQALPIGLILQTLDYMIQQHQHCRNDNNKTPK